MAKTGFLMALVIIFTSCSSSKITNENNKELDAQKNRDKSLEETVRIENEVFQLVGCTMIKKVEVKSDDAKRVPYDIRQKARDLGGNVLNDLAMRESFQNHGETIFEVGKKEYLASADVYRCHI